MSQPRMLNQDLANLLNKLASLSRDTSHPSEEALQERAIQYNHLLGRVPELVTREELIELWTETRQEELIARAHEKLQEEYSRFEKTIRLLSEATPPYTQPFVAERAEMSRQLAYDVIRVFLDGLTDYTTLTDRKLERLYARQIIERAVDVSAAQLDERVRHLEETHKTREQKNIDTILACLKEKYSSSVYKKLETEILGALE